MNQQWTAQALAHATLAQIPGLAHPPPPLPAPPLLDRMLLESPFVLAACLAAAALAAVYVLARRGRPRAAAGLGAGLGAAAAAVVILAGAVQTRRETVAAATIALVDAVARVDEPAMRRLLAPDARLFVGAGLPEVPAPATGLDREQIITQVRAVLRGPYPIRSHRAAEVAAEVTGPNAARSQLRVRVVPEGWNYANNSWWRLQWRLDEDGQWRAVSVTPWSIDGLGSIAP